MRIVSDFHDYWDTAYAFGGRDGVVYDRRRSTSPATGRLKRLLDRMPERGMSTWKYAETGMSPLIVVVAGKAFLGFARSITGERTDHVYGAEAALSSPGVAPDKDRFKPLPAWGGIEPRHAFNAKGFEGAEEEIAHADLVPECVASGVPLLAIRYDGSRRDEPVVDLNPCLGDIGFMPVMGPYALHQEVDMFVSGVLPDAGRPTVTLDDAARRDKAGFDDWSFRRHRDDPR